MTINEPAAKTAKKPTPAPIFRPTVMRSTRTIGAKTETTYLPGVRDEKGELIAWVPLGMTEDRAREVAGEMVAEREARRG